MEFALVILNAVGAFLSQNLDLIIEILGVIVGLFYLYYEYKASSLLWIAGIIMPAISLSVYYRAGLYADFGINVYYLIAAVYGWIYWKYKGSKKRDKELPITRMPVKAWIIGALVFAVAEGVIYYILVTFTDSTVPGWDTFTTALSIVGMWLLAKKYVEQWLSWILVDIVSSGLYIYKEIYFYSALYALYAVIAVFGYYKWLKLMKNEQNKSL